MKFLNRLFDRFVAFLTEVFDPIGIHEMDSPQPAFTAAAGFGSIHALLLHLCDFDREKSMWVMRWLAYPLRNPGAQMGTALVINGGQGNGKSLFFEQVAARLHGSFARSIANERLHSSFNGWADDARFVLVEGMPAMSDVAKVKLLITSSTLTINEKGRPSRIKANQLNFVFLSNSMGFIPLRNAGRRYMVIEAPPVLPSTIVRGVVAELASGGIEAFLAYLLNDLDMRGFEPHTAPPKAIGWEAA